jgi:outer membrane lipoprotein carrier protein
MLLVGMLAVSAFAADTDLTRVLKAVETRYNGATSLQVLFREEYTPQGRPHRSEAGLLTMSKPGRMRWEYSQPKGRLWISDGKQVFNYLPDESRVERSPLRDSDDLHAPLAFLLGKLHFDKEFRNLQSRPEGNGGLRITAEPKVDTLPYSQVEFVISGENHILEVKVTGFDKSILVYTFDQEKMNPPVDPKLFQFRIPAGAEVVEVGQ